MYNERCLNVLIFFPALLYRNLLTENITVNEECYREVSSRVVSSIIRF